MELDVDISKKMISLLLLMNNLNGPGTKKTKTRNTNLMEKLIKTSIQYSTNNYQPTKNS